MKKPALLALALFMSVASAQQEKISYKATEMAPGIVMLEGVGGFAGGNLGLWSGEDGVVLIDDGMQPYLKIMLEAIEAHAGAPVNFVINTHVHGDHIGNNAGMSMQGATIIAHDNIRERLVRDGVTGANGKEPASKHMLPEITFSDGVTLHLNGHRAEVIHVMQAHTDGDAIIFFADADVIHCGDVFFNGLFPYIDLDSGGSVDGYIAALDKILAMAGSKTRIIPGHGPAAAKADLESARDMMMTARDRVRALVAEGKNEDDIVGMNPLADFDADWSWGFITTERMTRTLVRDARSRN